MPNDEEDREARRVVTYGLNDQKTIKQLSSSGDAARANRPNAMARHVEEIARAQKQSAEGRDQGGRGQSLDAGTKGKVANCSRAIMSTKVEYVPLVEVS
jgi:hypothetical protein